MTGAARRLLFIAALIALAAGGSALLRPVAMTELSAPDLESMLPDDFGAWRRVDLAGTVLPQEIELQPGEAVAYRAYADDLGRTVTLVAAYGPPLGDSVRLHRPEACYAAQGFAIRAKSESVIDLGGGFAGPVVNLDTESASTREAVTYWLREGRSFTTKPGEAGWRRLKGAVATPLDGALVRASTRNAQAPQFELNRRFLTEFAAALDPEARRILIGEQAVR